MRCECVLDDEFFFFVCFWVGGLGVVLSRAAESERASCKSSADRRVPAVATLSSSHGVWGSSSLFPLFVLDLLLSPPYVCQSSADGVCALQGRSLVCVCVSVLETRAPAGVSSKLVGSFLVVTEAGTGRLVECWLALGYSLSVR